MVSIEGKSYTVLVFANQPTEGLSNIVGSTTIQEFGVRDVEDRVTDTCEMVIDLIGCYEEKARRSRLPRLSGVIECQHVLLIKDYHHDIYKAFVDHEDGWFKVLICWFASEPDILQVEFRPSAAGREPKMVTIDLHDDYDNWSGMAAAVCEDLRNGEEHLYGKPQGSLPHMTAKLVDGEYVQYPKVSDGTL